MRKRDTRLNFRVDPTSFEIRERISMIFLDFLFLHVLPFRLFILNWFNIGFCSCSLQDWKLDRCNKNRARTFIGFDENDACREEGRIIPMDHMTGGYCVRIHLKKKDIELFSPHRFYIIQNSFTYKYWSPFICVCLFSLCLFFNCSSIFWNLFFVGSLFIFKLTITFDNGDRIWERRKTSMHAPFYSSLFRKSLMPSENRCTAILNR